MTSADPPFVVDLHAHFPMQFDPMGGFPGAIRRARKHRHERLVDKLKFFVLEIADRFFNREEPLDGHAVTIDTLREGGVGVALSVAYNPLDELDLESLPGTPPRDGYFARLERLLDVVEDAVKADGRARIVRNPSELRAALDEKVVAMIHAVEGGFHLGDGERVIADNAKKLAERGVGYVTVAHLLWRRVSTNAAALPFLSDRTYHLLFPEDPIGLEERGRTLVRELVRHGILLDLTHMSERGMDDVFALLDQLDPKRTVPLIASHVACRMPNGYEYNLREPYVRRIAERGGICGVIYCDHFVRDHEGSRSRNFDQSFGYLKTQIEKLLSWGGDDIVAIGSDLDGFIKPTLAGLSSARNHKDLAARLEREYGRPLAEKICHANALRVFESAWMTPR